MTAGRGWVDENWGNGRNANSGVGGFVSIAEVAFASLDWLAWLVF